MNHSLIRMLRPAVAAMLGFTILTIAYTGLFTGVAQALFPWRANGSLLVMNGAVRGSALIAQRFAAPRYFWSRPSATAPDPYDASNSAGSNLGPTNPALTTAVEGRIAALHAADSGNAAPIPVDLVTASGSGLDPHISPAAAEYQVARVARARGVAPATVSALVSRLTQHRTFGLLGEPRVNVLRLNLALDSAFARSK